MEIPPLGMVDDLLCISECGFKTTMLNTYMIVKTNSKKLGETKCKNYTLENFVKASSVQIFLLTVG